MTESIDCTLRSRSGGLWAKRQRGQVGAQSEKRQCGSAD